MGMKEGWHELQKARRFRTFVAGARIAENLMKGIEESPIGPYDNVADMNDEPQDFTCGLCGNGAHEVTIASVISQRRPTFLEINTDNRPFSPDEKDIVSRTGWLICGDCGAGAHTECIS